MAPTNQPVLKKVTARILAIFCEKGGIGKSTTTLNVTWYAESYKRLTLLVDLDAQKNATNSVCTDIPKTALTASMLFKDKMPADKTPVVISEYLHLIPGDDALRKIDSKVDLDDTAACREYYQKFRENLRFWAAKEGYELVVIDTPPTAELRYTAALVAADVSVAPTTMDAFGMDGIANVKQIERNVKSVFGNPRLKHLGILPNKVEKRSKLNTLYLNQLKESGIKTMPVTIYLRSDIAFKLHQGKRSREMKEACDYILQEVFA